MRSIAIVLGLRLKPCSPPAALRGQAGEFRRFVGKFAAELRNALPCRLLHRCSLPRNAIVSGSRLKPAHHQQPFVVKLMKIKA